MSILYETEDGKIFLKAFQEQLNKPFYLNGDSYKNTYRKTCKEDIFEKNYKELLINF